MQRENEPDTADWGWEAPLVPDVEGAESSPEPSTEQPETNRLAVATLILGLLGIFFLAVPLGMVALAQIRNRGQQGGVLARAGMAASMCYVLAGVMVVAFFPIGGSDEEDEALPPMLSRNLSVGDCVKSVEESDMIDAIPVVPCDQPHAAEVIIQFPVEGSWPGRDESARRADARCSEELTPALIDSPMLAELRSFIYFPANAMQWRNYPKVSCLVMRVDGRDLTLKIPR